MQSLLGGKKDEKYGATDEELQPEPLHRRLSSGSIGEVVEALLPFDDGDVVSIQDVNHDASLSSEVANMIKNIVGAGVLSLPGGLALFADSPSGVVPAVFWILVLGAVFGYFCVLIARACDLTFSSTYRECWEKTMPRGALLVSLSQALKPAMANLAYASILSQTGVSLLEYLDIYWSRISVLWIITLVALLPLCLLKNLRVLAPFSVLGTAGILYTALGMLIRYVDGSYQPGGVFHEKIGVSLRPSFGSKNEGWGIEALPFVCMVFESYIMHYNAPRFYMELEAASIPRFTRLVSYSFGASAAIFCLMTLVGFLTFGSHSDSYILNNYANSDPIMTVSRLTIFIAILLSYPLAFVGFRDGVIDSLGISSEKQTSANINLLTVVLLFMLTILAMLITDLGLINAVGGGTIATALCFVFPALMYDSAVVQDKGQRTTECYFALTLMVIGIMLGLVGVWVAIE